MGEGAYRRLREEYEREKLRGGVAQPGTAGGAG